MACSGCSCEARELVAELCRHFYAQGWVTGTGGSITVKVNDPTVPLADRLIVMSPSGVQKERMVAEDMYVMAADGKVLSAPVAKPWPNKPPKCTDCAPLFMKAYLMRGAGAVIHSHGIETCIATMLIPGAKEFRVTHMEMIKGIKGHGYHDELVIPIIENTPYEYELTDSLSEAIAAYPKATAVLVRNHGIYVWGESWINAKTQAECYHYLLDACIKLYQLGIDWTTPEHGSINNPRRPHSILSPEICNGCHAADSSKIEDDLQNGVAGAVPVPPDEGGKEEVINSLVANVESMIKADRKITSLKQLQGHIWRIGFQKKELQGVVFEDVPVALKNWHASGIKVYIYSSGSREAQRLLFGNTTYGDLRKFLCGYFDTTTGNKRETRSYFEISQSLGVDSPSQILFITDVFQEAIAAKNAGFEVIISIRPGNAPLPDNHGFRTIKSFSEI
uniref:Probable methylthioribulose-1-phosphate dehydratase n=1 Tax=Zea mays TaxID=4577 RepID=A0A804NLJ5_MAIZE